MKISKSGLWINLVSLLMVPVAAEAGDIVTSATVEHLNKQGVEELQKQNWRAVFSDFYSALDVNPNDKIARENLAIAHNNYGLYLASQKNDLSGALSQLHEAAYLAPQNKPITCALNRIIEKLGKNPKNFNDRSELGNSANEANDMVGAVVEYTAALSVKEDPNLRRKLQAAKVSLKRNKMAHDGWK